MTPMKSGVKEQRVILTPKDPEWRCPLCKRKGESNKHHTRPKVEGKEKSGPTVPLGKGCHAFLHERYTNGELRSFFEDCTNETEALRKLRKLYHTAIRLEKFQQSAECSKPLTITLDELRTFWQAIGMPPYNPPHNAVDFFFRREQC